MSIEFSANAVGIGGLLTNDSDFGTDVKAIEDAVLGKAVKEEDVNAADEYQREMEKIAANLSEHSDLQPKGMSFGGEVADAFGGMDAVQSSAPSFGASSFAAPSFGGADPAPSFSFDVEQLGDVGQPQASAWSSFPTDKSLSRMTADQVKQEKVDSVMRELSVEDVEGFDKDVEDDDKAVLLQQISMLRGTLIDDGIDISRVDEVDHRDSKEKISLIYKTLRLKNDSNRSCALAEELILAGAHALAYLFDGEKDWFGRKPDLVGWPDTVKVKLRRVRYESSTLVKDMMQEHNISPGVRIGLELLPSMFLYSRNRKVAGDTLVSSEEYKKAISELNST